MKFSVAVVLALIYISNASASVDTVVASLKSRASSASTLSSQASTVVSCAQAAGASSSTCAKDSVTAVQYLNNDLTAVISELSTAASSAQSQATACAGATSCLSTVELDFSMQDTLIGGRADSITTKLQAAISTLKSTLSSCGLSSC